MRKIINVLAATLSLLAMSMSSVNQANAADSAPVPAISLTASVGSTLVANPGDSWDTKNNTFQWYKNSAAIPDAVKSSYKLSASDYLAQIYVAVSGRYLGSSITKNSSPITVAAGSLTLKPVPTISGSATVGSELTANAGTWDAGVTLAYQWFRNSTAIDDETESTYTLDPADLGKSITVKVTGSATGYNSETITSAPVTAAAGSLTLKPEPTVSGSTSVGSVLTANAGTWDTDVTLAFQWYRDGSVITNSTSSNYTLVPADLGKSITVKVTGSATGYASAIKTSSALTVTAGSLTLKPTPTITGSTSVGSVLTAVTGTWDVGVTFSYQWFRDGVAITNATSSSYTLVAADFAKPITVRVTGSVSGYSSETTASASVSASAGSLYLKPVPTVTGSNTVGSVLTANAGTWDSGVTFAYQWFRDGVAITNEVSSTYVLVPADLAKSITVKVTGSATGYTSETKTSSGVTSAAGSLTLKPVPTVTGSNAVGSVLTANAGTWDSGVTFAYQWFRDGVAINNATSSTYTLVPADLAKPITVKVTGSVTGYNAETKTSAGVTPAAGSLTLKPVPTVTGSAIVGSVLTANAGTWDAGVTFAYQWYRDGVAIPSATSSTYTLVAADSVKPITVKVTGSTTAYTSETTTSSSVTVGALTLKPVPTVSGSVTVGSILTAVAGTWDAGVTFAYQWYRDGVAIPSATSSSYSLVVADFQKSITVKVTGSAAGYTSETTTSAGATVAAGSLTLKPVPTVTGSAIVGSVLTANAGTWDSGVTLAYQWFRDGVAITNATSSTYTLVGADSGKPITVKVTGSKTGYESSATSAPATPAAGSLTFKPVPTVTGSAIVGSVLTANAGTWDAGVTLAYQWFRDGLAITNATSSTYTLVGADSAKSITLKVTGSATGYNSETTSSAGVTATVGSLTLKPAPSITGSTSVGSVLTANTGTWDAGVTFAYQWYRDGAAIPNAISPTYTLIPADLAKSITVKVTGSATGYTSETKTSAPASVLIGTFTLKPVPTVTGSATVGSVLTANAGTWDAGVTFAYQWYRDGVAIPSATTSTYTLVGVDLAKSITVKVAGSATGYTSETTTSVGVTVAAGSLTLKPVPTVTGSTGAVGSVLTAVTGTWDAGVAFAYQWFLDSVAIPSATASTFTMTAEQVGHVMSLTVTGSKLGYSSVTASSVAIMPPVFANTPCSGSVDRSDWLTKSGARPTISGVANVGLILTAKTGSWDAGTNFCTFWYSNGHAIIGAYSKTYKVQASDLNQNLQFIVIGTDKSGNSVLRYSEFLPVTKADFKSPPAPKLIGQARVGFKISASITTTWSTAVTYSFQWLRNGVAIEGAKSNSYTATQADLGARLSVTVCGSKSYYNDLYLTSESTSPVIAGRVTK